MSGDGEVKDVKDVNDALKHVEAIQQVPWTNKPIWHFEQQLKYDTNGGNQNQDGTQEVVDGIIPKEMHMCSNPGCEQRHKNENLLKCSRCGAKYCSRVCQKIDWRIRHKTECPFLSSLKAGGLSNAEEHQVVEDLLRRVRMYLLPYGVAFIDRGEGCVFVRSNATLLEWIYEPSTLTHLGQELDRHLEFQYLTLGEFDGLAFEDDFEMAAVRPSLEKALQEYDREKQVVIVFLLRCGYFGCITLPLIPEYGVCKNLASQYAYASLDGPLRLNLDTQDD